MTEGVYDISTGIKIDEEDDIQFLIDYTASTK